MNSNVSTTFIAGLALGAAAMLSGCTSPDASATLGREADLVSAVLADGVGDVDLAIGAFQAPPAREIGQYELEIWGSRDYRRRLADSYLAESDVEPTATRDELILIQEVLGLLEDKDLEGAAEKLDRAIDRDSSPLLTYTLGSVRFDQQRYEEAIALFEQATLEFNRFRRAYRSLGSAFVKLERYGDAIAPLARVVELGGSDGPTFGFLGFAYLQAGEYLSAEQAFRMAMMLQPESRDWKLQLAIALDAQRNYPAAVALFDSMLAEDPADQAIWFEQARTFVDMGEPMRAAENFVIVDELGGSTKETLSLLGKIYVNAKIYDLGVDAYLRSFELEAPAAPAQALLAAGALVSRSEIDETERLLDGIETLAADQLSTEDRSAILKIRSRIAVARGAGDEEARILRQSIELNPLDGDAMILLGRYHKSKGDFDESINWFRRAADLAATEADAKAQWAAVLIGKNELDAAIKLLEESVALKPQQVVQDLLDQVKRRQGR